VVAEVSYLVGENLGPAAETDFFRMLCSDRFRIEPVTDADLARIVELTETYADLPLGGTDASVIAVAERLAFETVATLDRRHFSVVRPRHVEFLTLLP
jgi:predicted nucleic acid-binding protein